MQITATKTNTASSKIKILTPYVEMRLNKLFYDELNSKDSIFIKFDKKIIRKLACFISGETQRACAVGIAGETASGKSTIAYDIIDTINTFSNEYCIENAITRVNTDDYYYDRSEMVKEAGSFAEFAKHYDLDIPEAQELDLMAYHIKQLLAGRKVYLPKYDLSGTAKRTDNCTLALPSKIIISEGLFTLTEKIAQAFDIKIYVHVSGEVQKARFYKRAAERNLGDSADEVYKNASNKAKIYIHPTSSTADIILSGEADRQKYKIFINRILCLIEELHHKDLVLF